MNNLAIAAVFCFVAVYGLSSVDAQGTGSLMCYNCTFVSILGFDAGQKGCKEPFAATGIEQISCDGSCVKRELEGDVPTTMRTCQTLAEGDCVNLDRFEIDPDNFVSQKCCSSNLCNSAGALAFNLFVVIGTLCAALAARK